MKLVEFTQYNSTPGGEHTEPVWINPEKVIGLVPQIAKRRLLKEDGRVDYSHTNTDRESTSTVQIIYGIATEDDYGNFAVIEDLDTVVERLTEDNGEAKQ